MNINNAFPSKWLKSGDVPEDADLPLTIKAVSVETVGQGDDAETKPVIFFEETEKGMVLNKTNAEAISKLHTPETDNWPGKRIALFATEVDFAGKQTLALRVRLKAPKNNPAPVPAQPNNKAHPLFTNTSHLSPATVAKWEALVEEAHFQYGVDMNFNLDETDTPEVLADRVRAVKAAISHQPEAEAAIQF